MEATCGGLHFRQSSSTDLFGLPAASGEAGRRQRVGNIEMPIRTKNANQTKNVSWAVPASTGAMMVLGAVLSPVTTASAQDSAKIEAGENVFNTNCAVCHGDQLVSTGQTFDLRRLKDSDRARFDNSVRNGKNQMPPWRGVLTDEEIDQVWHYIRANAYQK
jgi:mono/diheme cytochrome c family protein